MRHPKGGLSDRRIDRREMTVVDALGNAARLDRKCLPFCPRKPVNRFTGANRKGIQPSLNRASIR